MSLLRKIVEKKKSEKYSWPEGWMTRAQAADDLGVAPREVDETLKEAVRDGDVEKQFFQVYDARQGRVVREPGYRVSQRGVAPVDQVKEIPAELVTKILAGLAKFPDAKDSFVARSIYKATKEMVAAVRAAQNKS